MNKKVYLNFNKLKFNFDKNPMKNSFNYFNGCMTLKTDLTIYVTHCEKTEVVGKLKLLSYE